MSSVHVMKAQPAHHLYIATDSVDVLAIAANGTTTIAFTVATEAVLADMGKTVVLASGTYKKVKAVPIAGGNETDGFRTGYICMGNGSAAASSVAVLL
jgi:hypothetical protein